MQVHTTTDGAVLIENPDRELMYLMACKHRLKIMVAQPGGRWRVSPISAINHRYGTKFQRAHTCLDFVNAQIDRRIEELKKEAEDGADES